MIRQSWSIWTTSFLVLILGGCGNSVDTDSMIAAQNDTNVKRLATLYSLFQLQHELRGPADEAEFRKFISGQDPARLARADIDPTKIDDLFMSERDGQPFNIRYGIDTVVRGPSYAVIFESEGVDGRRQVGFTNGKMQEVDSAEYDALLAGERDEKTQAQQNREG